MTPEHIEKTIDRLFEKLAHVLSKSTELGRLFGIGLVLYFALVLMPIQWTQNYPQWSRLYLVTDRYWLTLILCAASYFYRWLPSPWFHATVLVGAWGASAGLIRASSPWILAYPVYFLTGFAALKWLDTNRRPAYRGILSLAAVVGFLLCLYTAGIVGTSVSAAYFQFFWTVHPEYSIITFLFYIWSLPDSRREGDSPAPLLLSPSHLSYPLPLPPQTHIEKLDSSRIVLLWWRGFLNLVVALALFVVCLMLGNQELPTSANLSAIYQYVYFLIFISASMNILTGFIRMFGIDTPAASRYVAFASSPLDVWRRGAAHVYTMVLQFVFIPVMRRSRSVPLTVIACTAFIAFQMFFFHEIGVRSFYSYVFPEFGSASPYVKSALVYTAAFALGWLALVLVWQFTVERWKGGFISPTGIWLRVALNHILIIVLMIALSEVSTIFGPL